MHICIKVVVKKPFINDCRIVIVSVTRQKAKIVPFGGMGGILHITYILNEFDDLNFFPLLACVYCKIQP